MDQGSNKRGQPPFRDLTNTNNIDPKERKRERERARSAARRAAMSDEQRMEINKKRREAYHQKNTEHPKLNKENIDPHVHGSFHASNSSHYPDGIDTSNTESINPDENDDWLFRNDSYLPRNLTTQLSEADGDYDIITELTEHTNPALPDLTPHVVDHKECKRERERERKSLICNSACDDV